MPIRTKGVIREMPGSLADFDRIFRNMEVEPDADSVGTPTVQNGAITPAKMAVADTAGKFLVRRGTDMVYDTVAAGDIPATFATDVELAAAIAAHEGAGDPHPVYTTAAEVSTAIAAHEGLPDPHPGYLTESGVKHARITTGSIASAATALVTITWGTAFADANYTVSASVVDSTTSSLALSVVHVETVSASQVAVRVINNALGSLTGTVHVIAIHD